MIKKIKTNYDRVLVLDINDEDEYVQNITINEYFISNNKLFKSYTLSMWDDFAFNVYVDDVNLSEVEFKFNCNHPLYLPLLNLLNNERELIIDDDLTKEYIKKYISINIKDNTIYLKFNNKLIKNELYSKKFYIFIKNIMIDGRSKIDRNYLDTKERLCKFFYHAIDSIENYNKNIIFLDIDGVLNSGRYFSEVSAEKRKFYEDNKHNRNNIDDRVSYYMLEINEYNLNILKSIIEITNSKVVITSSWKFINLFDEIVSRLVCMGIPIIDKTIDSGSNRGEGILNYVKEHNIDNYIVIDDEVFKDYNDTILSRLVKTSFDDNGLDEVAKVKAIRLLNNK